MRIVEMEWLAHYCTLKFRIRDMSVSYSEHLVLLRNVAIVAFYNESTVPQGLFF